MFRLLLLSGLVCAVFGIDLVKIVDDQIQEVKDTQEERRSGHRDSVRREQATIQDCEKAIAKAKENIEKYDTEFEENKNKQEVHRIERNKAEAKLSLIGRTAGSRAKRYEAYEAQCKTDVGDGTADGVLGTGITKVESLIADLTRSQLEDNKVEKGGGATVKKTKFKSGKVVELLKTFRGELVDKKHEREQECARANDAYELSSDNSENETELTQKQKDAHEAKREEHKSQKGIAKRNAEVEKTILQKQENVCEKSRDDLSSENASFAKDEKGFRSYMNSLDKAKEMLKENVKYIPQRGGQAQFLQTTGPDVIVRNVLEHLSHEAVSHHLPSLVTFVAQLKNHSNSSRQQQRQLLSHRNSFLHRLQREKDSSTWFETISNKIFNRIDALKKEQVAEGTLFRDTKNKMRSTKSSIQDLKLTIEDLMNDNDSSKNAANTAATTAEKLSSSINKRKKDLVDAKEEFRSQSVVNAKQVKELGHAIEAVERIIVHFQDGDEKIENETMKKSRENLTGVFKKVLANCEDNKENAISEQRNREREHDEFKESSNQLIDSEAAELTRQKRLNDQATKKSVLLSEKIKSRDKELANFEDYQDRLFKSYGEKSELTALFKTRTEQRGKEIAALHDAYDTLVSWKKENK